MPALILGPIVAIVFMAAAAFTYFPYLSTVLMAAAGSLTVRYLQKKNQLDRLQQQIYLDDVAAFKWRDDMSPLEFERRCADAMRILGWSAQTTKASGDQGVDVIAERNGVRIVLQCKKYSSSVGNKAVQEAFAAKTFVNARYAAVITNNQFTPSARALAERTGVLLLHFSGLANANTLFGFPNAASYYSRSTVTKAEIEKIRNSRLKRVHLMAFYVAGTLGLVHDLYWMAQNSPAESSLASATPSEAAVPALPNGVTSATVGHFIEQIPQPKLPEAAPNEKAKTSSGLGAAGYVPKTLTLPSQSRTTLKTSFPALLRDGNTFCTSGNEFDLWWHWTIMHENSHEPSTPSCTFIYGEQHPLRVSVLRRLRANKTMVRIDEGGRAGQTGYTDAYLP